MKRYYTKTGVELKLISSPKPVVKKIKKSTWFFKINFLGLNIEFGPGLPQKEERQNEAG